MHEIVKLALGVLLAYGAVTGVVYVTQRNLLYFPPGPNPPPPAGLKEVDIATHDGLTLTHWYRPPATDAVVIVMFHGNASSIAQSAPLMLPLLTDGQGLLLAEYRGYGGNPGRPTEADLIRDGRGVLRWLEAQGVGAERIVLYGQSLGTGVAVRLAAETEIAGLVLEAPFSSVADVAQVHYGFLPVRRLIRDRWDSMAVIDGVRAPLLIVHGEQDRIIPIRFGRKLFAAAREPKQFVAVPAAGHNDVSADPDAVREIRAFLSRLRERR